jgi:predicted nucleic acid-binding protein
MKYLLDTDTLIDVLQNRGQTRIRINALIEAGDEVAVCSITIAELYTGLNEARRQRWHEWLLALPYWDISREAAMQAGIDRKSASEAGQTLHISDCLVAACAREQQAIVLTSNIKDYPMKDVRVLSLRENAA